ncbi:MAG: RnfABCDGE type electron transport complex subunit D [Candidatus Omnitrophica bacterium]|jgi:electron transport complex protein RnfD|nr:RnfABCDGE type electron transport complex subunit D [Candidatus Omnitrophota bacterium]
MKNLTASYSPHLHTKESLEKIMWLVFISLIPSGMAGVLIFGMRALWVIFLGIISAIATEALIQLMAKKKVAISDGSAALTGLLLSYNLPVSSPWWLTVTGSFIAVAIGKQIFGGLGQNIFNPALVGRVFLMASWPKYMTNFTSPVNTQAWFKFSGYDAITAATPLTLIKEGKPLLGISYMDLFLGKHGGCIGEVCILAILAGALFLLIKKYISWHIPITYILTVAIFTWIFGPKGAFSGDWLFAILSGGLILGAFFMATDYVTSPLTRKGQLIFGVGCGVLTAVIRLWGGYPEGASYAILIMNATTPIIDRYTKNRIFGK